jgi:hypothetical protein
MAIKIKDADGNEHEVPTATEMADMVTGAVKASSKKLQSELTASLTSSLGEAMAKTLTDYDAKRQEAAEAAEAERQAADPKGKGKTAEAVDIENSPAFRGMQKKLDAALRAQAEADARAKAEASKAKDTALRQSLSEALDKNSFDPKARHLALSHLVDGAKLVRYSEDGETIVFRDSDGADVDLATGIKGFAQTDDGKRFMPASGASGTGDRSRFTPITQPKTGKLEPGTLGRSILALADSAGSSGVGTG